MSAQKNKLGYAVRVANSIGNDLLSGASVWDYSSIPKQMPFNPVSKTIYKGVNLALLLSSVRTDPRWLTFLQIKNVKLRLKKGADGVPITYYQASYIKKDDEGIKVDDQDTQSVSEETVSKKRQGAFWKYYWVFNAGDIEGADALNNTLSEKDNIHSSLVDLCDDLPESLVLPKKSDFEEETQYLNEMCMAVAIWACENTRTRAASVSDNYYQINRERMRSIIVKFRLCQIHDIPYNVEASIRKLCPEYTQYWEANAVSMAKEFGKDLLLLLSQTEKALAFITEKVNHAREGASPIEAPEALQLYNEPSDIVMP